MKCEQCKSDFQYTSLVKGKCLCERCESKKTTELLKKEIEDALAREDKYRAPPILIGGRWLEASGGELVNMDRMAMVRINQRHGGLVAVDVLGAGINIELFTGSEEECAGYMSSLKSKLGTIGR